MNENDFLRNDAPIKDSDSDLFDREILAKEIANTLLSFDCKENSFVASLNGEWGSGKTSIINLVKNEIVNLKPKQKVKIIDYSPWNVINQKGIIRQFFKEFVSKTHFDINKKIYDVSKHIIYLILLVINFIYNLPLTILISRYESIFLKNRKKSLLDVKKKIKKKLVKKNRKYIIFIDDLDRLNQEEIHLVIQLIKSVCDFPNVVYLLAFDKKIVESAFDSAQPVIKGNKYIEKIIQFPFNIPELNLEQKTEFLIINLKTFFPDFCKKKEEEERFSKIFNSGLVDYFTSIRSIKRFINALDFSKKIYKNKLDFNDLLTIEAIRLFDNQLFEMIIKNRDLLCGGKYYTNNEDAKDAIKGLENKTQHFRIIKNLFPYITQIENNARTSGKTASKYAAEGRLCCIEHMDYYLSLRADKESLFKDDVFKSFAKNSLEENNNFFKNMSSGKYTSYLNYLSGFAQITQNIELISDFLPLLFKIDRLMIDKYGGGNIRNYVYINSILEEIYLSKGSEKFISLVNNLLSDSVNFYTLIHILYMIGSNTQYYTNTRDPNIYNKIGTDDIHKMNNILSLNIKNALIKAENYSNDCEFYEMIRFLYVGKKTDFIKDYYSSLNIEKLIDVMNNLIFKGWVSRYVGNTHETKTTYTFMHYCFDDYIDDNQKCGMSAFYEQLKKTIGKINIKRYYGLLLYNMPIIKNDNDYYIEQDIINFAKKNGINPIE